MVARICTAVNPLPRVIEPLSHQDIKKVKDEGMTVSNRVRTAASPSMYFHKPLSFSNVSRSAPCSLANCDKGTIIPGTAHRAVVVLSLTD
jgi:hypothetical protein